MSINISPKEKKNPSAVKFRLFDKLTIQNNSPFIIWGFCFFLSFIFLLICTKSSPLYPFNDWADANAFFTMGKGMMNGKVLYRDLFEQKGPLLYFIHGLSYLISAKSFLGVFIFEVISFSFFLFYSFKSISLFFDKYFSLIYLPIIAALTLNLKCFSHGDSAEEFCLPLMAISLFYLIDFFRNGDSKCKSGNCFFWNGIIAGCVLWVKFSLLGFWIGWICSMLICLLVDKQYRYAVKGSLLFFAGLFLATLPWILYFGLNHSISEWINVYIILNLTSYPISRSLLFRFVFILLNIAVQIYNNPVSGELLWLGIIVFIAYGKFIRRRLFRISLLLCVALLFIGIYGGGRGYLYYYLITSPLIIFGIIVLQDLISKIINKKISWKTTAAIIMVTLILAIPYTLKFNQNTYMLGMEKEDLVQYKYASIINQSDNATLLNYGWLDFGFYTTTGITPNVRFFEKQNIGYEIFPLNVDEQNRYIKEKTVEYVVVIQPTSDSVENLNTPYLFDYYDLIETEEQESDTIKYYYYLFKQKN